MTLLRWRHPFYAFNRNLATENYRKVWRNRKARRALFWGRGIGRDRAHTAAGSQEEKARAQGHHRVPLAAPGLTSEVGREATV